MELGRDVLVVRGCYLDARSAWLISIGDEASAIEALRDGADRHDAAPKLRTGYSLIAPVYIGARAFIGANATILPGVTIGTMPSSGPAASSADDVQAGAVVLGNPPRRSGTTDHHRHRHRAGASTRPRFLAVDGARSSEDVRRILAELEDGPARR